MYWEISVQFFLYFPSVKSTFAFLFSTRSYFWEDAQLINEGFLAFLLFPRAKVVLKLHPHQSSRYPSTYHL